MQIREFMGGLVTEGGVRLARETTAEAEQHGDASRGSHSHFFRPGRAAK